MSDQVIFTAEAHEEVDELAAYSEAASLLGVVSLRGEHQIVRHHRSIPNRFPRIAHAWSLKGASRFQIEATQNE